MADFQRYQPRRARVVGPAGRRFGILAGVVVVIVIIWWAMAGGSTGGDSQNENSSDITLLTNTDNTNTPAAANTNTAPAAAPDTSAVAVKDCTTAIGSYGQEKRVALTFNVAAANEQATALFTTLEKAKVAGSFFVTGVFAEKNPDFVKSMASKGYGVYNRSYDNARFTTLSAEDIASQLAKTDLAVADLTGHSTKPFFRAPYGDVSEEVVTTVQDQGYCTILWTVDALDWSNESTVESSAKRVLASLRPGAIVMLSAGYDITPDLVSRLVTDIKKAGYQFVTLANLFAV